MSDEFVEWDARERREAAVPERGIPLHTRWAENKNRRKAVISFC